MWYYFYKARNPIIKKTKKKQYFVYHVQLKALQKNKQKKADKHTSSLLNNNKLGKCRTLANVVRTGAA